MELKNKITSILSGAAILAATLVSQPAMALHTITFNSAPGTGNPIISTYTEVGFTLTSTHMHTIDSPTTCAFGGCVGNGTVFLSEEEGGLGGPITMTSSAPAFNLEQFDGAEAFLNSAAAAQGGFPNATQIQVVGTKVGGGTVTALFNLDGIADGDGGVSDFQIFVTGAFTNLTSVTFSGLTAAGGPGGFSLDNINVHPVPEPGTFLLFGAGLAGFLLMRRRKLQA